MSKKLRIIVILLAVVVLVAAYLQFNENGRELRNKIVNSDPLEIYIGGACTCPPSDGENLQVINLYKSKGESLEKVKHEAKIADCSQLGCAQSREFRLYP